MFLVRKIASKTHRKDIKGLMMPEAAALFTPGATWHFDPITSALTCGSV